MIFIGDPPRSGRDRRRTGKKQKEAQFHEKSHGRWLHHDPGGMLMSVSHHWELSQPEDEAGISGQPAVTGSGCTGDI